MAFVRVLAQLSRGLLAEHTCAPQSHIRTYITADGFSNLQKLLQIAPKDATCQRAFHTLHRIPLSQASSTAQSSAGAARSGLRLSCISTAPQSYLAQAQQHCHSSSRCSSVAPALVRRWQPGPTVAGGSLLRSSGSSAVRAFSAQAQRSQQRRQLQKKSSEQGVYLVALVVGMIGLTYASVPLYRCAAGPASPATC